MQSKTLAVVLVGVAAALGGCCGQIKDAAREHAAADRTVASTLETAGGEIVCSPDAPDCPAALEVIQQQAAALNQAADTLDEAAQ